MGPLKRKKWYWSKRASQNIVIVLEMIHVTNHVKSGPSGFAVVKVIYSTQIAITT